MADTLKSKFQVQASANSGASVSDTVGSAEVDTILSLSICNTTTTDTTIDLYVDPSSGSNTYIYLNQPLPAKSTFIHNSKIVLKQGDVLKFETSAAVSCQVVTSYLHQTAVATSSGSDYLDRTLLAQTGSSQSMAITPDNTSDIKTVLSFTICNQSTTDTTFDVFARASGGGETLIYQDQSLPAEAPPPPPPPGTPPLPPFALEELIPPPPPEPQPNPLESPLTPGSPAVPPLPGTYKPQEPPFPADVPPLD